MKSVLILSLGIQGGSLVYAQEIIDHLNLNKTVVVARNSITKPPHADFVWTAHRNIPQFAIYSLTLLPFYLFKVAFGLMGGKYEALYLPYLHFWSIFFILVFKLFRRPTIITVHDGILHAKNGIPLIQYLITPCIKAADELIFLSEYVKKGVEKELAPAGKSYVIPHGLIVPDKLQQQPRTYKSQPNILFFGKVLRSKGVENLIEACLELPSDKYQQLWVVGKYYYPLEVDPNDKIQICDRFIPETEVADYFNQADILVVPYTEASQSGVVAIGIAACIPMVCTNVGGLREQLTDEEAIFVEPNPQALKEGILHLIENPELYATISTNLFRKQKQLQWSNIAKDIESVISKQSSVNSHQ